MKTLLPPMPTTHVVVLRCDLQQMTSKAPTNATPTMPKQIKSHQPISETPIIISSLHYIFTFINPYSSRKQTTSMFSRFLVSPKNTTHVIAFISTPLIIPFFKPPLIPNPLFFFVEEKKEEE